jgi:hypothetical protein
MMVIIHGKIRLSEKRCRERDQQAFEKLKLRDLTSG